MSESDNQAKFHYLYCQFGVWAHENGHKLTFGDAFRDKRAFGETGSSGCAGYGTKDSLHKKRRAVDSNYHKDAYFNHVGELVGGDYNGTTSEDYLVLCKKWESMDSQCRSGYRYNDANHFEFVPGFNNREDPM